MSPSSPETPSPTPGESSSSPGFDGLEGRSYRTGTAFQYRWLQGIVKWVLVLNVLDAVLTLVWIYRGTAVEANPLLQRLAHTYPVTFVAAKLALVSLGSLLLWRLRRSATAVVGIFVVFIVYYFILVVHLRAMGLNLFSDLFRDLSQALG